MRFSLLLVVSALFVLSAYDLCAAFEAAEIVSPARADALASPVLFRSIQTSTEAENMGSFARSEATPCVGRAGIETWIGGRVNLYDLPLSCVFSRELQAQLDIPFTSVTTDSYSTGRGTETGLGDVVLSIKYRAEVDQLFESYYIFATKFPTGASEKGLGTGAFDFSFTHKTKVTFGDYRATFMAGVAIPPPVNVTILGSRVEYGPTVSYMVAAERRSPSTGIQFGIKAAGLHSFNSRINAEYQKNALTTLDLIPEGLYRFSDSTSFKAGIVVPLISLYSLPGAANRRDPMINIGIFKTF